MTKKLWSDGKTDEDIEEFDRDTIIYNLLEDIQCLREDKTALMNMLADCQTQNSDYRNTIKKLRKAVAPLAKLDLTGVTHDIIYARNKTDIRVTDVKLALSALSDG